MELGGLPAELVSGLPGSDEECVERLIRLRWGKDGFRCTRCRGRRWSVVRSRPRVRSCGGCGRQTSVTSGTLLHRTRVDLRVWFLGAALLMRAEGCQARELAWRTGIHVQTAWRILHRLRTGATEGGAFLLRGAVSFGSTIAKMRRPCTPWALWLPVKVVADASGGVVARTVPERMTTTLIAQHAPHVEPGAARAARATRAAQRWAWRIQRQLKETHHWVSERWLPRYLGTRAFRESHEGADRVEALLRSGLNARARAFEDLAPPMEGHWVRVRERRRTMDETGRSTWGGRRRRAPSAASGARDPGARGWPERPR